MVEFDPADIEEMGDTLVAGDPPWPREGCGDEVITGLGSGDSLGTRGGSEGDIPLQLWLPLEMI